MPRKPQPWFRFYVETFHDRKIRHIPVPLRWAWAAVLGAARESPEPGRLMIAEGVPMTVPELADYAAMREKDVTAALDLMVRLGMISRDGGVIAVRNFHRRQFLSDDVTARTRTHRERSKERSNDVPGTTEGTSTLAGARDRDREQKTEVELDKGGERRETSRPAAATKPPTEPTCSAHPAGDQGDACGGCAKVREHRDRLEVLARDDARRAREQCPDCHGGIWLDNGKKCTHPRTKARTA